MNKEYEDVRNLRIFVWNCQTINLQQEAKRKIKIEYILKLINDQFPDIIFLIDAARQFEIGGNYEKTFDGRNILWTRKDINFQINYGEGQNWIEIVNCKLGFIYIIPNNYDKGVVTKKLEEWNANNWTYFGDFNMKSNKELWPLLRWSSGENSLQTGVAGKYENLALLESPSDHRLISVVVKRKVKYGSALALTRIIDKNVDYVDKILTGDDFDKEIPINKYKIIRVRAIENTEERTILKIINKYNKSNPRALYDRFGWMWRRNRKEPFMGNKIPQVVFQSFKKEFKHEEKKKKSVFREVIPNIFDEADINRWKKTDIFGRVRKIKVDLPISKSKAITMENIKLDEIGLQIRERFVEWIKKKQYWRIYKIQNTIVDAFNQLMSKGIFYSNTFFLRKQKILSSFRDVRMLTVVPVLLKVWETLTYYKVIEEVNRIMEKGIQYQFGARKGASTYQAMAQLRAKIVQYGAVGMVSIDLVKGYEKVSHKIMSDAINFYVKEEKPRKIMRFWLHMVIMMDYNVSGQMIKSTVGIPMGLSFSPVMFILYIHYGLRVIENKEYLLAFMDDMNILILEEGNNDEYIKDVFKALESVEMVINERKSYIVTNEIIGKRRREETFRNIEITNSVIFLGREIKWVDDMISGETSLYVEKFSFPKVVPNWLTLGMRRIIIFGGICAKRRYICYMWAFKRREYKEKFLRNLFTFLSPSFAKFNYVQLLLIYPNLYRELIDYYSWCNLGEKMETLLDKNIEVGWRSYENEMDIYDMIQEISEENVEFWQKINELAKELKDYLETGIEQVDLLNDEGKWNMDILYGILIIAAKWNSGWDEARKGLNEAYQNAKRFKITLWAANAITLEKRKYAFDLRDDTIFNWKYIKSIKYFGILMDMFFGRIDPEGKSDWEFFIFDVFQKFKDYVEGKTNLNDFLNFKNKVFRTFIPSQRFELLTFIVENTAKAESTYFGNATFRWHWKINIRNQWFEARKFIRKLRKVFYVLDSLYANRAMRNNTYEEILLAFQVKLLVSRTTFKEFEKVMNLQDWEELDKEIAEVGDLEMDDFPLSDKEQEEREEEEEEDVPDIENEKNDIRTEI